MYEGGHKQAVEDLSCIQPQETTIDRQQTQGDVLLYLVVHCLLLADQLRAQD